MTIADCRDTCAFKCACLGSFIRGYLMLLGGGAFGCISDPTSSAGTSLSPWSSGFRFGHGGSALDVHMTIFLSFFEFKAEAEYMNLETKNTKAGFLDFL